MIKVAIYGRFNENFPREYVSIVLRQLSSYKAAIYVEKSCLVHVNEVSTENYKSFDSYKDLVTLYKILIFFFILMFMAFMLTK